MTEIGRISGPCDEVVHVRTRARQSTLAIETPTLLDIDHHWSDGHQIIPLAPEQELVQVGRLTQHLEIQLTDITQPCTTYKV